MHTSCQGHNHHINPAVGLPSEAITPSECYAIGWGLTERRKQSRVLLSTDVQIFSHEACNKSDSYSGRVDIDAEFCAGQEAGRNDVCGGDSGGPLVCYVNDVYIQYGVVSWGIGCGRANKPGVYSKVASVVSWIKKTTKGKLVLIMLS